MAAIDADELDFRLDLDFGVATPGGITRPGPLVDFSLDLTISVPVFPSETDTEWTIRLTDQDGELVAMLPTASWSGVTFRLNEPRTLDGFAIPATDPAVSSYLTDGTIHEFQVYRGKQLIFFGPISRPRYQRGMFHVDAADPLSYLSRRVVGDEQTNELADPDFEEYPWLGSYSSWGDWYIHKKSHDSGTPATVSYAEFKPVSDPVITNADRSLQLHNSAENDEVFLSLLQSGDLTAGEFDLEVTFVCYVQLGAAPSGYTATQGHGIALGMYSGSLSDYQSAVWPTPLGMQTDGPIWEQTSTAAIDPAEFPRQTWERIQTSVTVPAGETRLVVAEIACPDGETLNVAQRPRLITSEGLEYRNNHIGWVIDGLVDHAQDAVFNKSDLNLTVYGHSLQVGPKIDRAYPYAEHQNVWQAVSEFTRETVDVHCRTQPTVRYIDISYPQYGRYKQHSRFEVRPKGGNCELVEWVMDTDRGSSRSIWYGAGSGIGRDVDYSTAPSAHGGVTLETVEYTDPLTTLGNVMLEDIAEEALSTLANPEILTLRTFPDLTNYWFMWFTAPGDWVPVRIWLPDETGNNVLFNIADDYRVMTKTIEPTDAITFVLNRRDQP